LCVCATRADDHERCDWNGDPFAHEILLGNA